MSTYELARDAYAAAIEMAGNLGSADRIRNAPHTYDHRDQAAVKVIREQMDTIQKFRRLLNPIWMQLAYNAMGDQPARDDQFIFTFMGGGGSDMSTVADFREVMGDEREAVKDAEL